MAELNYPDPLVTNPWQDPNNNWWEYDGDGWLRLVAAPTPTVTGFKNVLINGNLTTGTIVNQRNFDGNWTLKGDGDFGWDRWAKWFANMYQPIENANLIHNATYVLHWKGGGNGEININGTPLVGPSPLVSTADTTQTEGSANTEVPTTAYNIQLELGNMPTAFEIRPIGLEELLSYRYYQIITTGGYQGYVSARTWLYCGGALAVPMRTVPNILSGVLTEAGGAAGNIVSFNGLNTKTGTYAGVNADVAQNQGTRWQSDITLDSEL